MTVTESLPWGAIFVAIGVAVQPSMSSCRSLNAVTTQRRLSQPLKGDRGTEQCRFVMTRSSMPEWSRM